MSDDVLVEKLEEVLRKTDGLGLRFERGLGKVEGGLEALTQSHERLAPVVHSNAAQIGELQKRVERVESARRGGGEGESGGETSVEVDETPSFSPKQKSVKRTVLGILASPAVIAGIVAIFNQCNDADARQRHQHRSHEFAATAQSDHAPKPDAAQ